MVHFLLLLSTCQVTNESCALHCKLLLLLVRELSERNHDETTCVKSYCRHANPIDSKVYVQYNCLEVYLSPVSFPLDLRQHRRVLVGNPPMSLPFRYLTVGDYVDGTIQQLQENSVNVQHLKIGKYYLHGSDLEGSHMISLFRAAEEHDRLNEISLSGVNIEDEETFTALVHLLQKRKWKTVHFVSCRGKVIQSLSAAPVDAEAIRIKTCEMSQIDFCSLGQHLQRNCHLESLEVFEENLNGPNVEPLMEGLEKTRSLRMLEMSYCSFDTHGSTNFARGLEKNKSLDRLSLPGCELEDEQLAEILTSLSHHPDLRSLQLHRNHCGQKGAEALARMLSSTSRIRHLDFSFQQIERDDEKLDTPLLAVGLRANTSLEFLKLSFNKFDDEDAKMISKSLKGHPCLKELDLRANSIKDDGASSIAENLVNFKYSSSPSSLRKLYLYGNDFGDMGGQALSHAIRRNVDLQVLNMDYKLASYDEVQFYICLNRAGRRLIMMRHHSDNNAVVPPSSLYPLVLARTSDISKKSRGVCHQSDLLYTLIRHAGMGVINR